jgi:anti-sigma regulatory factor (Ser/Thr protein kinase)/Fe-S-cluster-containing hydrogenase component 2
MISVNAIAFTILGGDYETGGAASRAVKEQLKKVGADPVVVRRAMIAAYEAEMNVVIHARRGTLRAVLESGQLDVEVVDEGPGIPDIEKAMQPGFSTASAVARELGFGAGMGLPNIKKSSDRFDIESTVGQGTRISFTILLKPQSRYGVGRHSVEVKSNLCRQSLRCVRACPTQAIRVFRGRPQILDYLCVDCTACVAVCPSGSLTIPGAATKLPPAQDLALVVTAESLVQAGAGVAAQQVLSELRNLGYVNVAVTAGWEAALRRAVKEHAAKQRETRPLISPACPAVVNLIEMRFPSLIPQLAPFEPAILALAGSLCGQRIAFVVSCPAQRTALLASSIEPKPEVILPAVLRAAVMPGLATRGAPPATVTSGSQDVYDNDVLRVTGPTHVSRILEAVEDGLATDVQVLEPWMCPHACFGSPLLSVEPHLAAQRWRAAPVPVTGTPVAASRAKPFEPRKGLRLDDDMGRAIAKLAKIDKLTRELPGSDCTICGAPSCAALAEDIVLGRAVPDACTRRRPVQEEKSP